MIIFGTRGTNSTIGNGNFHCPRCGPGREYSHIRVKRWFTLYFIPVIPLGVRGYYVECHSCGGTFGPEVLEMRPQDQPHSSTDQIKRIFVLAACASGEPNRSTIDAVRSAYWHLQKIHLEEAQLKEELRLALKAKTDLVTFGAKVADVLADEFKYTAIVGCSHILSKQLLDATRQEELLFNLGYSLNMSKGQINALLEKMKLKN